MRRVLLLLLLAAGALTLFLLYREHLPGAAAWLQERGLAGALLVAAVYAVATVLMVPGSAITLGVGLVYGPWWGMLLVSPASVLGATLAFLLGRGLLRRRLEERLAGNRRFAALDRAIAARGPSILLLARLSPVLPFVLLNYAFGLTRIQLRHYVLASWLGMLPGTFLYVYLGSTLGDVAALAEGAPAAGTVGSVFRWAGLAATVAVTVLVTRTARRALREAAPGALETPG